ncbi:MAG: hypothetical protein ACE14V_04630 [bacterium]
MKRNIIIILILMIMVLTFYIGYRQAKLSKITSFDDLLRSRPLNYESLPFYESRLAEAINNKIYISSGDIVKIFGKPELINAKDLNVDNWYYRISDTQYPQYYDITMTFSKSGKMITFMSRYYMINPATVKLVISQKFWQERVVSQIDAKYLNFQDKQYHIQVEARAGLTGYVFNGPNERAPQIDRKYDRQLFPGTYTIYLEVINRNTLQVAQRIVLSDNIQLAKNETKQLQF